MNAALNKFLEKKDKLLFSGNAAILCNQISFDFNSGNYLFEILTKRGVLRKVFIPEHGLFAELQDQVKLNTTNVYSFFDLDATFISLYGSSEGSLFLQENHIENIDAFVIDLQDVGCRYFTYLSTIFNIFKTINQHSPGLKVYVIDKPNPAGRQVEGSRITEEYASFIGMNGLPNRHGLTIGEMCNYLKSELDADFDLEIIPFEKDDFHRPFPIQPSPNFPSTTTARLYSGQCLFEGTILSEGRGTTRPFEIIGAPFLSWKSLKQIRIEFYENYPFFKNKIALRPIRFVPTFHKFSGETCMGFQLHILKNNFHSLAFSLLLMESINRQSEIDIWRKNKYEFGSEKTAIELLVGDKKILRFLNNSGDFKELLPHLSTEENLWITKVEEHLLYPFPLFTQRSL